ncbi:hypothetical protein ACES2I_14730 [Bdellovibrio bacteriovorus]|uniref:hypothetical protein n=1 Tax=Bdellovibrio bacteriovorus TaxID=959 RepID=UPI0035A72DCE
MKTTKFIEAEQIAFEEVAENWVSVKFGDEKFVIDVDTLFDLSFRCASFLAQVEAKEEEQAELQGTCACEAIPAEAKVH